MSLLHVNNITKNFETGEGTLTVLRGVSLDLISGKSLALTGESGSGKSTLLYLIGGLDVPDDGRIEILGQDIASLDDPQRAALRRGTVGVVFQQFNLIPSLNVAANLSFHARLSDLRTSRGPSIWYIIWVLEHFWIDFLNNFRGTTTTRCDWTNPRGAPCVGIGR